VSSEKRLEVALRWVVTGVMDGERRDGDHRFTMLRYCSLRAAHLACRATGGHAGRGREHEALQSQRRHVVRSVTRRESAVYGEVCSHLPGAFFSLDSF